MSHNHWLITASLVVAIMAGFTGLSVLQGASNLKIEQRKRALIMAAIAMGTGIWSMHFVAMLGMKLPTPFFYDALTTLISALVAILVVGIALLLLHFMPRTSKTKIIAGIIVGLGILAMHYFGMFGIRLVHAEYSTMGIVIAIITSIILSVSMIFISYNERENKNIIGGAILFGIAVFMVHFVAMVGTHFTKEENLVVPDTWLSNEYLAIGVAIASFIISGSFLLMSVGLLPKGLDIDHENEQHERPNSQSDIHITNVVKKPEADNDKLEPFRIPYEKNNRTYFIDAKDVAAVRAEGHYTILYVRDEKLFCSWTISEMTKRLTVRGFLQTHRSYLVNPIHVTRFERKKDNGICWFDNFHSLEKVPVSRSQLSTVRKKLALD